MLNNLNENINQSCQILDVVTMGKTPWVGEKILQYRNRFKRIIKRRLRFVINLLFKNYFDDSKLVERNIKSIKHDIHLMAGDIVQVRTKEEITATLNNWNNLKGCSFMEEMWCYCGTKQKVFKRVERFLDERDYLIKKGDGIILLDGVYCKGTKDFGPCDRSCFFFWREEWLEKIGA